MFILLYLSSSNDIYVYLWSDFCCFLTYYFSDSIISIITWYIVHWLTLIYCIMFVYFKTSFYLLLIDYQLYFKCYNRCLHVRGGELCGYNSVWRGAARVSSRGSERHRPASTRLPGGSATRTEDRGGPALGAPNKDTRYSTAYTPVIL